MLLVKTFSRNNDEYLSGRMLVPVECRIGTKGSLGYILGKVIFCNDNPIQPSISYIIRVVYFFSME